MTADLSKFKKTNVPGYLKDEATGTVINMNQEQLDSYRHAVKKSKELSDLKQRYENLESELSVIKKALGL